MEINDSSSSELMKVINTGNVGINIGTSTPTALLHVNSAGVLNIRHENLLDFHHRFIPPFNKLGVDASGNSAIMPVTVKYLYYQQLSKYPATYSLSNNTGGFSLYDPNQYINIPIINDAGLKRQ